MKANFQVIINFEQNNWAQLLLMTEFAYNNAKNTSIGYTPFKLNCRYYLWVSYEKNLDSYLQLKIAEEISSELRNLIAAYQQNLYHAQEIQKQAHNKRVKPQSYAPGEKIWLNSKYLKTKRNCKLEAKFLGFFWVLHPVGKQAYKLELPKKWKIHNIFHISLLEQDITKKGQVNNMQLNFEFEVGKNKKYELDGI